jgi:kinesin family protein 1
MGREPNIGLVPQVCEEIFKQIDQRRKQNGENQYEITFSMIEIYNETIRDLLNLKGLSDRKGNTIPFKHIDFMNKA